MMTSGQAFGGAPHHFDNAAYLNSASRDKQEEMPVTLNTNLKFDEIVLESGEIDLQEL